MLTKMRNDEDFTIQTKGGGRVIVPDIDNNTSAYLVTSAALSGCTMP